MEELTKRRLANSLKKFMAVKPFDKITVRELVEDSGYNRQTFYYHFQDIYDLGKWMFDQDVLVLLKEHDHFSNWEEGMRQLLHYLQENRAICLCALHSLGRDYIKRLAYTDVHAILRKIVDALSTDLQVDEAYKDFLAHFYAEAFAGVLEGWLREPKGKETPAETLIRYMELTMEGNLRMALERSVR